MERDYYTEPWKQGYGEHPRVYDSDGNGEGVDAFGEGYWDGYVFRYTDAYRFLNRESGEEFDIEYDFNGDSILHMDIRPIN